MVGLRSFSGKNLVAFLRNGDYAHAGEEEAILQTFAKFPKSNSRHILDAGCGNGGTAKFLQDQGWGRVVGIDIEQAAIDHAQHTYPDVEFYCVDVVNAPAILPNKFDLICMFNAFYAFNEQQTALRALRKVATDDAKIVIFDYLDLSHGANPLNHNNNITPLMPETIGTLLNASGWNGDSYELYDVSSNYIKWYQELVDKLETNKNLVISKQGQEQYDHAHKRYSDFIKYGQDGSWGGAILYADAADS